MLKKNWLAAKENEIYPQLYPAGTVLTGELLERAKGLGLIEDPKPDTKAAKKAPETK